MIMGKFNKIQKILFSIISIVSVIVVFGVTLFGDSSIINTSVSAQGTESESEYSGETAESSQSGQEQEVETQGGDVQDAENQNDNNNDDDDDDNDDDDDVIPTPPDETISVPGEKMFHLETSIGTQSVINGKVPIYLYVKPYIDSSRAELEWEIPRGLKAQTGRENWFKLEEDTPRTFKIMVSPQQPGEYEIIANVTAWRYDTNYVDAIEIPLEIDQNLNVVPKSSEYNRNKMLLTGGLVLLSIGGIAGLYFLFKFGKEKFRVWMSQD
jgi:hypothetical protein